MSSKFYKSIFFFIISTRIIPSNCFNDDSSIRVKDNWFSLNEVLNEYNWPIRSYVINALSEVINEPKVYKISNTCNESLIHFLSGLQTNSEDSFRCKYY